MSVFSGRCLGGLILACGLACTNLALADDPPSDDQCNVYFEVDNQTGFQMDARVRKKHNAANVDMPDLPPTTSGIVSCYWLENSNREGSVELAYESVEETYVQIRFLAQYKNDELDQSVLVINPQPNVDVSYDKASTTLTIADAD